MPGSVRTRVIPIFQKLFGVHIRVCVVTVLYSCTGLLALLCYNCSKIALYYYNSSKITFIIVLYSCLYPKLCPYLYFLDYTRVE